MEHEVQRGPVEAGEQPVERVGGFRFQFSGEAKGEEDRHQGDGEQGGKGHGEGLGAGERAEEATLLSGQGKDREKGDRNDQEREEDGASHRGGGLEDDLTAPGKGELTLFLLQTFVGVFHQHDRGVHHGPDGDGHPAEAHDVGGEAKQGKREEGKQQGQRQRDNGDEGAAHVAQEEEADHRHHQAFLEEFLLQIGDGAADQVAAVIDRNHLHALRQGRLELLDFMFDALDHTQGVFPVPHDDDAAHGFPAAVQLSHPDAGATALDDGGDVPQKQRAAHVAVAQGELAEIVGGGEPAASAHDHLGGVDFQGASARIAVGFADGLGDLGDGDAGGGKAFGIEEDLDFTDKAADRGDLGNAGHGGEGRADHPILQGPQPAQVLPAGFIDEGVLVNPTQAVGIGSNLRFGPGREDGAGAGEEFADPGAGPVQIRAFLEDDVEERAAVDGFPANRLDLGGAEELRLERESDLVLHQISGPPGPFRDHDDLGVGKIRQGIEGNGPHGHPAGSRHQGGDEKDESGIPAAGLDDLGDKIRTISLGAHGWVSFSVGMAPFRRASESRRKLAEVATRSPSFRPSRTSTRSPNRSPARTRRGSRWPLPRSTKTTWSRPRGSRAEAGTLRTETAGNSVEAAPVWPGRSWGSGFSMRRWTLTRRVSGSVAGSM